MLKAICRMLVIAVSKDRDDAIWVVEVRMLRRAGAPTQWEVRTSTGAAILPLRGY